MLQILKISAMTELKILVVLLVIVLISALISRILSSLYSGVFGKWGLVITGWIGVSAHEMAHALFCLVFRHRITEISLFNPGKGENAGFVRHSYDQKSLYQSTGNFFISFAPLATAPVISALLYYLLVKDNLLLADFLPDSFTWLEIKRFSTLLFRQLSLAGWNSLIWLYLTTCLAAHMNLSFEDLKVSAKGGLIFFLLMYPLLVIVHYFNDPGLPDCLLSWTRIWFSFFMMMAVVALAVALLLWLISLLTGLIEKK